MKLKFNALSAADGYAVIYGGIHFTAGAKKLIALASGVVKLQSSCNQPLSCGL